MKLAGRVQQMTGGGSDGWDVYYRARDRMARGERILNLTVGEHDIPTDPSILGAMHRGALAGSTGYTVGAGKMELREAIARRVAARTGVPTRPENVVVTPGGQAALFAAHMVLLDAGDRALFCDPYYATYPATIRATGAQAVAIPARSEDGFRPDAARIDAEAAKGARTLLINTPNNPTGIVYDAQTLGRIATVCRDRDLWLISDEVYDTQIWDGEHLSPRALPGMAERTIVLGSLSKSHAMTGSRLGWMIAPEAVIAAAVDLATNTTYGTPGFIQDAAVFALNQGPAFEEQIAAPFRRRRALIAPALAGSNRVSIVPSGGGMFVMLDIRATGLSGEAFALRLLDEEGIAVMPGESFGAAAAGHVRVAMTIPDEAFAEALARLGAFADRI